jgi:hypothetical protein
MYWENPYPLAAILQKQAFIAMVFAALAPMT